jgi:quercetin dioxygenase-like cupin family protein
LTGTPGIIQTRCRCTSIRGELQLNAARARSYAIGIALFGLGIASTLVAQSPSDSPRRIEQKRADLSGAPGMEVIVSVAEYQPGDAIGVHIHHGIEAGYVLQGSMTRLPGHEPTPMLAGTTLFNLRDTRHAVLPPEPLP